MRRVRRLPRRALPVLAAAMSLLARGAEAQEAGAGGGVASLAPYAGTYEYRDGATIALVAAQTRDGPRLVAVLDEAKYPLRTLSGGRFLNGAGDTIPFRRDALGRVTGFVERGTFFARLADTVPREAGLSVVPRPFGPSPYRYAPPPEMGDGLAVGHLAPAGLPPEVAERIVAGVAGGEYADVDAVLVHRNGALVLEEYFHGYDADRPHQMRSASKSVVSLLAGLAIDRGALPGVEEPVLARLPYGPLSAYANPDPRKETLTLAHLLSMRSGLACDDWDGDSPGNENRLYGREDWVKATLDLPQARDPGTEARYCTGGIHVAGRVVERAVGTPLPAFAQTALFAPLGIGPERYRWPYVLEAGNARTIAQIYLRPRDLLKLGVLVLDGGRWRGRQVVSSGWIARSTARLTRMNTRGYGLGWWHQPFTVRTPAGPRTVEVLNASGHGGQKLYVVPEANAVVVFTGSAYASENSPPNRIMAEVLLPALLAASASPAAPPAR